MFRTFTFSCSLVIAWFAPRAEINAACVWRVTGPNGGTLYLGGSIHALRSTDYPLPSAYNRAFDASSSLVFEDDPNVSQRVVERFLKTGEYLKEDSLKNHLDPRTYGYLQRVFSLWKVPEEKFAKVRPWFLVLILSSPSLHGLSHDLGVEGFLEKRARANSKPVSGLESFREHIGVFSGLTDQQSEKLILLTFIPQQSGSDAGTQLMDAWRKGDADTIARINHDSFRDFPSFHERLIGLRNRNWMPKIESYLRSGKVYFVVAGAAHMGGPSGLLALLKARGYRIEEI